jgi:dTDP-4-dehydrorhamnose 3,5-epimerase
VKITPTEIEGALLAEVEPRADDRGLFARVWCSDEFARAGVEIDFVQANTGFSHEVGTIRGLHFQRAPHAEWKLIRCTAGAVFDVALDLRPDSDTYLQWFGAELSAENRSSLLIPPGCAHGYQTLAAESELMYLTSQRYSAEASSGVRFDDPSFSISWPLEPGPMSAADRSWADWLEDDNRMQRIES